MADRLSENPTKLPNPDARHAGTGMTGMMSSDCSHSQASSRPTRSTRGVKVMYNKYYKEKGFLPPLVQKQSTANQNQTGTGRDFSRSNSALSCTSHSGMEGSLVLNHSQSPSRIEKFMLPTPHTNLNYAEKESYTERYHIHNKSLEKRGKAQSQK